MKTILIIFFKFFFVTLITCSQESKNTAQLSILSEYDEWKIKMSGVYEGHLETQFMDSYNSVPGTVCIDLASDTPMVSFDGVIIPDFELNYNNFQNKSFEFSLISIEYEEQTDKCIARFEDVMYQNEGKDIYHSWDKTANHEKAREEIEKIKSDNKLFSEYWIKFLDAYRSNDFKEITSNVSFPIVDSCTKEVINNEIELENKLRNVLSWETTVDIQKNSDQLRIVDHYAKSFGGKYYYQRNGSIFWDIIDGEVKLMNFHCLFG